MKKIFLLLFLVNLLVFNFACDNAEEESIGIARLAGVNFVFDFDEKKLTLINRNNTVIRATVYNLSNNSVLSGDIITWPGSEDNKYNLSFKKGHKVEIRIWQGPASVFWGNFLGIEPDFIGQAVLREGKIAVVLTGHKTGWHVQLPITNGGQCHLAGQYAPSDIYDQSGNNLYCDNLSVNWLYVELFVLRPAPSGYEADFKIASFWVYFEDIKKISYSYNIPEPLALRITSYDPYSETFETIRIYGFFLDIASQSQNEITSEITLP